MKFNCIISNPPYNKDMYLDFVEAAYRLLTDDGIGVFITPAKFYAKGGKKNEDFRVNVMPHIKEVHLFKCCTDVFDIAERGGIAYYSVYKGETFKTKLIQNHNKNASLASELEEHTEQPVEFMSLKCLALLNKISAISLPMFDTTGEENPVPKMYYCSDTQKADTYEKGADRYPLMSGVGGDLKQQGYIYISII